MQITTWLTIGISAASIIVGTITALSIAAMQRKQMRQIELHRADPSVPLVPPLHPVTLFSKRWGVPLINSIIYISLLTHELNRTGPVTREQVFSIAVFTGSLFLQCVAVGFLWLSGSILGVISNLTDLTHKAVDT